MPRQPFGPIRKKLPAGNITIGTPAIGERPELETLIGNCLMAWPIAESEMALTLGQLLGIGNEAALAVFSSLRRATAQRDAIFAAAEIILNPTDLELLSALLDVHKSIEAERTALAHGHFGTYEHLPDGILWMTTNDYIQLKAKLHLANVVFTSEIRDDLISRIRVYRRDDLAKVYNDVLYCAGMWPEVINWLRSRPPQRDRLYRQLCDQPRIAQALAALRRKNTPSTPPQ